MAALLAICASVMFGVADFFGGLSARRIVPTVTAAVAQLAGLVVLGVAALTLLTGRPIGEDLALGSAAGVVGGLAIGAFYFALSQGSMSVVAPVSAVTSAVVPVVAGLVLGESPGALQWAGVALALPAILLISREGTADPESQADEPVVERATPEENRTALLAGLGAGVGFGLFVVLITRTSAASGIWPLVASRSASAVALGVVLALGGTIRLGSLAASAGLRRTGLQLAVVAGVLDASSNVLILEAGRRGMLVLVGVIGAMYPASTIVLARVVLGERLQRHQLGGLALAVLAVVLIAR
jgi:drug/metabolite transporter (DMT)-like permease